MKFPIPIFTESGNVFTDAEIIKPKPSVIADTKKVLDTGSIFLAMRTFIAGCLNTISAGEKTISEKMDIRNMTAFMPYRTAEYVALKIMLHYDPELDMVEGIYSCPRCGNKIVCEKTSDGDMEIDTRDSISLLPVDFMENMEKTFVVNLSEPVTIKDKATGDVLESINSFELRHPTLNDCAVAESKFGSNDSVRMQLALYVEALMKINNVVIDRKYKNTFGMYIFENIKDAKVDLGALNREVSRYGIMPELKKVCPKCQKTFKAPIALSNFFVSGLAL